MVLKLASIIPNPFLEFESDVISDGTQTHAFQCSKLCQFESDVISDGTQTNTISLNINLLFESDVISDGTQTIPL